MGEEIKAERENELPLFFSEGSGGLVIPWDKRNFDATSPKVMRGLKTKVGIDFCKKNNLDYYYIDTGYFGNLKSKIFHRVVKNNLQYIGPIQDRPADRLEATGTEIKAMTRGSNVLLVPPSEKVMKFFNLDLDAWVKKTTREIKKHTDRKIVVRLKPSRRERITTNTMELALSKDIHCLVTFNSIAAVEALIYGKPAITLGPNSASALCSNSISEIENPKVPTSDEVYSFLKHLAYHQFLKEEMKNGVCWRILNGE